MSYPQPVVPVTPKRRSRTPWILGIVGGVLALCCGVPAVGAFINSVSGKSEATKSTAAATTAAATPTAAGWSSKAVDPALLVTTKAAPPPPPPPAAPVSAIPEGTSAVPSEVKPGTYTTTVPADSFGCYWARLRGTSGSTGDIIANSIEQTGSKVRVTIKASDKAFESKDCGVWTKVG